MKFLVVRKFVNYTTTDIVAADSFAKAMEAVDCLPYLVRSVEIFALEEDKDQVDQVEQKVFDFVTEAERVAQPIIQTVKDAGNKIATTLKEMLGKLDSQVK